MTSKTIIVIALSACGDNTAGPPVAPPSSTVERTIDGSATFVTTDVAGHSTSFPISLHDTLVSAQFAIGDSWDVREGVSGSDGTFSVAGPEGEAWLETYDVPSGSRQLLWTNADQLHFDEHAIGRGDARAAGAGTTMTFGPVAGLDPARADDGLGFVIGNLGVSANLFATLVPGATTLQATRQWVGNPLVSATEGDQIVLSQLRTTTDPTSGITYTSVVKSATFDSLEQSDRQDTVATGTFTTPPALDYELRWNRSEFTAASHDSNPRVGPVASETFLFRAMPGGTKYGTSVFAAVVLAVDPSVFVGDSDLVEHYAITNPYPASWLFNDFVMAYPIDVAAPGLPGVSVEVPAIIEVNTNELPDASHPIVPIVTPPLAPMIEGMDLFADHDGVGLTPMISWSPPAHGTPVAYVLTVEHWEIQIGNVDFANVATLIVPGDVTTIRMPARMLDAGEHYALRIAAIAQPGVQVRTHSLYTLGLPYGYADVFTNTFSP
jgi:hypothetical protein